jgi:hypothetical protein
MDPQMRTLFGSFTQALGTGTPAVGSIPSLSEKKSSLLICRETYCKPSEMP